MSEAPIVALVKEVSDYEIRISRPPNWLEPTHTERWTGYDDEVPDDESFGRLIGLPHRDGRYIQGTLPLPWTREAITPRLARPSLRLVGSATNAPVRPLANDDTDPLFATQRTPSDALPDPAKWAAQLGQAVIEVLDGRRSPSQLLRWTTPEIHRALRTRAAALHHRSESVAASTGPSRLQVRSVHVCEPETGIAEVSVVLSAPRRSRAMAMRLEGMDGRWRATVLMMA